MLVLFGVSGMIAGYETCNFNLSLFYFSFLQHNS